MRRGHIQPHISSFLEAISLLCPAIYLLTCHATRPRAGIPARGASIYDLVVTDEIAFQILTGCLQLLSLKLMPIAVSSNRTAGCSFGISSSSNFPSLLTSFVEDGENEVEHCTGGFDLDLLDLFDQDYYSDALQINGYVRPIQICTRHTGNRYSLAISNFWLRHFSVTTTNR